MLMLTSTLAIAQPSKPAFRPAETMAPEAIAAGLAAHDRALHIKTGWIRDPFITLGPDGDYYLTGTTPNAGDPRDAFEPLRLARQNVQPRRRLLAATGA